MYLVDYELLCIVMINNLINIFMTVDYLLI